MLPTDDYGSGGGLLMCQTLKRPICGEGRAIWDAASAHRRFGLVVAARSLRSLGLLLPVLRSVVAELAL